MFHSTINHGHRQLTDYVAFEFEMLILFKIIVHYFMLNVYDL